MITFTMYARTEGEGPAHACSVTVNGSARMFFTGITEAVARKAAEDWRDREYNSPARQERRAEIAARARSKRKINKAKKGEANE